MNKPNFFIAGMIAAACIFTSCTDRTVATTDQDAANGTETTTTGGTYDDTDTGMAGTETGADTAYDTEDDMTRDDVSATGEELEMDRMGAGGVDYDAALGEMAGPTRELVSPMVDMMQQLSMHETTGNIDQDFASMMIVHHQGAINISNQVLQSGDNNEIISRARELITSQQQEIEQLQRYAGTQSGMSGQQGTTGQGGTSGTSGQTGTTGTTGTTGQTEISGTGNTGTTGTTGTSGSTGTTGTTGGTTDQTGTTGTTGTSGTSGQTGTTGTAGQTGTTGTTGTSGQSGTTTGQAGTSGQLGTASGQQTGDPAQQLRAATEGTMERLQQQELNGDADHDYAHIMILHHQDAIEMAQVQVQHGQNAQLKQLAQQMIDKKRREISELESWASTNSR